MNSNLLHKQFNVAILLIPSLIFICYLTFTDSDEQKATQVAESAKIQAQNEAEGKITDLITFSQLQIKHKLKDGESAKFVNVYVSTSNFVCGEVNSKNSFNAYAGYQRFISAYPAGVTALEEDTSNVEFKKSWDKFCTFKTTTAYAQSEHTL